MGKGSRARPLGVSLETFSDNFEGIFGKRVPTYMKNRIEEMTPAVKDMKKGTCGCGRSPTGDCCGWHGLSESEFQRAQSNWLEEQLRKDNEDKQSN